MSRGEDWCWERFQAKELKFEAGEIFLWHRRWERWIKKTFCHCKDTGGGRLYMKFGPDRLKVYVHRLIWMLENNSKIPEGMVVDHFDENKLNNCPSNLRLSSFEESKKQGGRINQENVLEYLLRWFGFISENGREPFYEEEILYVETGF